MPTRPRQRKRSLLCAACVAAVLFSAACSPVSPAPAASIPTAEAPSSTAAEPVAEPVQPTSTAVEEALARFTASQSSATARDVVEAVATNGDERWVPWLIDLLRLQVSTQVSTRIGEVLETITGVPAGTRIANLIAHGSWAASRGIDGGPGYRDFKIALYERVDPLFAPLLASVEDQALLATIQWGGVPVGGIPELNDPARVPAADADWMTNDEVILGIVANGQAVAYPLRVLARHELANDTIGGTDISLVYCTLCKSAIAFERNVAGRKLSFLTSGLLANSNKIMVDVETNTLWSHLRGVGIGGELFDVELARRSVNHMRWSDWVEANPTTEVIRLPSPIFFDDPERPPIAYDYTPGEAYASYYDNPDVWFPVIDTPDTFALKAEVIGIEVNGDSIAIAVNELNESGNAVTVEVGGQSFEFVPTGVGVQVLDSRGETVVAEQSFWFAWFANHPDTRTLSIP